MEPVVTPMTRCNRMCTAFPAKRDPIAAIGLCDGSIYDRARRFVLRLPPESAAQTKRKRFDRPFPKFHITSIFCCELSVLPDGRPPIGTSILLRTGVVGVVLCLVL